MNQDPQRRPHDFPRMPFKIPNLPTFARQVMKRSATGASPNSFRTLKAPRLLNYRTMDAKDGVKAARGELLLNPKEVDLKNLLNLIAKRIDESKEFSEPVVLRWAGGWVRDRLLGIPSNDIDVAINNMTGEQFLQRAQVIVTAERTKPEEERLDCLRGEENQQTLARAFKVSANPEKSKHLETSTCTIFEQDVDFVNLRKEVYAEDSRNPQMEFGTPEEDAERRDATINAMFYNITHDEVEDFIGGKEDLQKGLIRTPLEPLKTFTDDPLRVLRLVRFASRYNFAIDENTQKYMYDPSVLDALRNKDKISRERVSIELQKMLEHKHPEIALRWIYNLHLYHVIFTDPKITNLPRPDISRLPKAMNRLVHLADTKEPGSIGFRLVGTSDYFAWYLVAMLPWMRVLRGVPKPDGMDKKRSFIGHVAYEGFRATVVIQTLLNAARQSVDDILAFKNAVVAGDAWVNDRGVVGMKLRTWQATSGAKWQLCVLNALLMETVEAPEAYTNDQAFFDAWMKVLDHLDTLDWKDILLTKPVRGPALKAALGVKKDGKWMKPALDVCLLWQLRNPGSDDLTGAFDEVKKTRKELDIPDS